MNILSTRDLNARLEELQGLKQTLDEARKAVSTLADDAGVDSETLEALRDAEAAFGQAEDEELAELESLESEVGSEWRHGETLIAESDFTEYAEQLADNLGYTANDKANSWPFTCIDWERAAEELKQDYSEVEYQGTTYLFRCS